MSQPMEGLAALRVAAARAAAELKRGDEALHQLCEALRTGQPPARGETDEGAGGE